MTANYCIYDKVPSLTMSFFVRIKGCVNYCTTTSVHKKRVLMCLSFSHWERFLKTTASFSNLIPPCFYNLTRIDLTHSWTSQMKNSYVQALCSIMHLTVPTVMLNGTVKWHSTLVLTIWFVSACEYAGNGSRYLYFLC